MVRLPAASFHPSRSFLGFQANNKLLALTTNSDPLCSTIISDEPEFTRSLSCLSDASGALLFPFFPLMGSWNCSVRPGSRVSYLSFPDKDSDHPSLNPRQASAIDPST